MGIPSIPGPPELQFLDFVKITELYRHGDEAPFLLVCRLVGMLGACLTQASRIEPRATVQLIAPLLRGHIEGRYGGTALSEAAVADSLPESLRALTLPSLYAPSSLALTETRLATRDTILYHTTDLGRRQVEGSRLCYVHRK